jgi:hypothetical protein
MNIEDTLAPASDQLDAIELVAGPRTFTITEVSRGNAEQPIQISLAEFPRVWRPSKGMRRVLAAGWGTDASTWTGHRVTLYFDPNVSFGKERTGGTRISHMSHIDRPLSVPLLVTRGKSAVFTVQPLPDAPAPSRREPTPAEIAACADIGRLRAMHDAAGPEMRALILARRDELTQPDDAA